MKIRRGFVSNSSSSSFCIYGMLIAEEDLGINQEDENFDEEEDEKIRRLAAKWNVSKNDAVKRMVREYKEMRDNVQFVNMPRI